MQILWCWFQKKVLISNKQIKWCCSCETVQKYWFQTNRSTVSLLSLANNAAEVSGCFISFRYLGDTEQMLWLSQHTNTIHKEHKYNTNEEQILICRTQQRYVVGVYFISYPAFWSEDREQIPWLGGMARFSLAPILPLLTRNSLGTPQICL